MDVGRSPTGAAAMMAISTSEPVPPAVVDVIRSRPAIVDARAIELG